MTGGRGGLWALIAAGTAARLVVAAVTDGLPYDVQSFAIVRDALAHDPLEVYGQVGLFRWPYPPAFFAWIEVSAGLERLTGVAYLNWIQLAQIAADAALAWLVATFLAWRGLPRTVWMGGAALVALGPSFAVISGYAVQIDSVAILPAAAALVLWVRGGNGRAWQAGLLIGLAAAIKTVPGVLVLALLPTARDRREALVLAGCAVALPAAMLLPFFLADPNGVKALRHYGGIPGLGGLTLAVQPDLAERWLITPVGPNGINEWVTDHTTLVNALAVGGTGAFLLALRVDALRGAVLLWLVVWAFGTGFFFQYLVWGLPFLLLAGYLRAALALQLVAIVPAVLFYMGPWEDRTVVPVFAALMLAIWLGWLAGILALVRDTIGRRDAPVPAGAT